MRRLLFSVEDKLCDECTLTLRRFIGRLQGIESIDVEDRGISICFDNAKLPEERLLGLATDSLERLGHKPAEHWHFINVEKRHAA